MKVINDQAIIVGLEDVDISKYPDLKVIGCPMTSTEHLPWEEINKRGIKVISLGTAPRDEETDKFLATITSTAEHTIGLILALLRNYKTALNAPYKDREEYKGHTLAGKTLGIIGGRGRIGRQVGDVARSFKMGVLTNDAYRLTRHTEVKWIPSEYLQGETPMEVMLKTADIITIHIPLNNKVIGSNEGFFTQEMFQKMKPTAYLINTSRDKVIEKGALLWALENKFIAGAAIDFTDDPDLVDYAKNHDNLLLTNHIGGCTYEDREKTEEFITQEVINYLSKETKETT